MATKIGVSAASPGDEKPKAMLTKEEVMRYSRHLIMPEVGMEGQLKIKAAKVLCIGTGGLGAPLGLYLAAAGVGRIGFSSPGDAAETPIFVAIEILPSV